MPSMKRFIPFLPQDPVVSVVRMQGVIASGGRGASLNDAGLAPLIERAFARGKPKAVALVINSPGGSPTQSSLIAARVRRLAEEKNIPVYAFVEDVAASGGYWLACAADQIFVDENSVVGSIGVISAGFGFQDLIARYGIERRVHTSGETKSKLDPFRPEKPEDVAWLKDLQAQIHDSFIAHVKRRRGDKLADGNLFNGDVWVGEKAKDMGLVDGIGHIVPKMKEVFGKRTQFAVYRQRRPLLARFGARMVDGAVGEVQTRAAYARYGL